MRNAGPRRIGFVDDRLDNFHADVTLQSIRGPLASRGFDVAGAWALHAEPSQAWAAKNNVRYCASVDELDRIVDAYVILAPSTPETHLALCERVFPRGKTTYVDKTFAPDTATARHIFELADRCGVAVQSSSALRYTNVQRAVRERGQPPRHLAVWGGGTSIAEYAIHVVELAVSILGPNVAEVQCFGPATHPACLIQFDDERTAMLYFNTAAHTPYHAALTYEDDATFVAVDLDRLFVDSTSAVLDFLESGQAEVPRSETLAIRSILDELGAYGMAAGTAPRPLRVVPPPKSAVLRGEPGVAPVS